MRPLKTYLITFDRASIPTYQEVLEVQPPQAVYQQKSEKTQPRAFDTIPLFILRFRRYENVSRAPAIGGTWERTTDPLIRKNP